MSLNERACGKKRNGDWGYRNRFAATESAGWGMSRNVCEAKTEREAKYGGDFRKSAD